MVGSRCLFSLLQMYIKVQFDREPAWLTCRRLNAQRHRSELHAMCHCLTFNLFCATGNVPCSWRTDSSGKDKQVGDIIDGAGPFFLLLRFLLEQTKSENIIK